METPSQAARAHAFKTLRAKITAIEDSFLEKIQELRALTCEASGGHEWVVDHCGYWQHQYCAHCAQAKYPVLSGKRCGELDAEMGDMTEETYRAQQRQRADTSTPDSAPSD